MKKRLALLGIIPFVLVGCGTQTPTPTETVTTVSEIATVSETTTEIETTVKAAEAPVFKMNGNVITCGTLGLQLQVPNGMTVERFSEEGDIFIVGDDTSITIATENVGATKDMDVEKYLDSIKPEGAKKGEFVFANKKVPALYAEGTKGDMKYYQSIFIVPGDDYIACITISSNNNYIEEF